MAQSWAYDFEVSARTEGYGYQLRRYDQNNIQMLNRRRITQYLGLRIFNLYNDGQWAFRPGTHQPPATLTFHSLLRFNTDFGAYLRSADPTVIPELEDNKFDLMLGALEGRNFWGRVDFTLGRQIDFELLDIFAFDGLKLRLNCPGHWFVESKLGAQLKGSQPFSSTVFETDGVSEDGSEDVWAPTFGIAIGSDDLPWLTVRAGYRGIASKVPKLLGSTKESESIWGIDEELLSFALGLHLESIQFHPQVGLHFNLLTAQLDELQAMGIYHITQSLIAQLEYLRSRPHFDGDSIFNIFNAEPFNDVTGRLSLTLNESLMFYARFGYRWFWSEQTEVTAADDDFTDRPTHWSVGSAYGSERLQAQSEVFILSGRYESKIGGDLETRWLINRYLSLEGRASLIRLYDAQKDDPVFLTFGIQTGARVRFVKGVQLHLMVEDNISRIYQSAFRLLAVMEIEVAP